MMFLAAGKLFLIIGAGPGGFLYRVGGPLMERLSQKSEIEDKPGDNMSILCFRSA